MRIKKKPFELPELKKGSLLVIKTPPYYSKEYIYEIVSAGDKLIRATLHHSPTVRKSWSKEELATLFEHGIVRLATEEDLRDLSGSKTPESVQQPPEED